MRLWIVIAALLLLSAPRVHAQPVQLSDDEKAQGWELLFDGRSLAGWAASGDKAAWGAKDGQLAIVRPGTGGWLRTTRLFRDFELALEFLVPEGGNSGVGLRGSSAGDPAFTGFEVQIFDSHGKPADDRSCGAVYNAIAPASQASRPAGEWNQYRIRLVGDTLDVWLNGVAIHTAQKLDARGYEHDPKNPNPLDRRLPTGFIALQDHGDPVRFRNVKIRDLSPDPDHGDWTPLFNGVDTAGWTKRGGGTWTAEGGTLVGRDGPGHLFTDRVFTDLELRAFVRVNARGNSGLYFRVRPRPEDPDTWPAGFEAQVDNHDPKNFTGCVYDKAWPRTPAPITRDEAWFDYRVLAVGDRVRTWINGVPMVDATLADFKDGHVALQTHHQGNVIQWRDLRVRDLSGRSQGSLGLPRRRAPGEPVRVLFTTRSMGFEHDVLPEARRIMQEADAAHDWLTVNATDAIDEIAGQNLPGALERYDVLMFFTTGRLPIDTALLEEWVRNGGAFVGVHSATDTLSLDGRYVRLVGGVFDGHPWNEDVALRIDDPAHPAMAPFLGSASGSPAPTFRLADEIYQFKHLAPDRGVVLSLAPGNPKMEPGRDYPLAWTRQPGQGRVFYTALGHRPEVWRDRRFVDHVLAGIRWAARAE